MLTIDRADFFGLRLKAADIFNVSRQVLSGVPLLNSEQDRRFREDGIAIVADFLPKQTFEQIGEEARTALDKAARITPIRPSKVTGFGPQEWHDWGFDRFDGGTLNRFVTIDPATMPETRRFTHHLDLARFCRVGLGMRSAPRKPWLYLTVHGRAKEPHDIQKDLHRDSCYRKIKFWYFLDPVRQEDGPFCYVPGSHKLTEKRLGWEQKMVEKSGDDELFRDYSFRISEDELADLDLPPPQSIAVPANTLVIADTFGFHRRGTAKDGAQRLSIYGQKKPWPFVPIGI